MCIVYDIYIYNIIYNIYIYIILYTLMIYRTVKINCFEHGFNTASLENGFEKQRGFDQRF